MLVAIMAIKDAKFIVPATQKRALNPTLENRNPQINLYSITHTSIDHYLVHQI